MSRTALVALVLLIVLGLLLGPVLLVIALPAFVGMFWGAPLISREFETGTQALVWQQSVPRRRWLAVVGSTGQPRDGNTAACYAMLDTDRATLTFFRVPYDWRAAADKIRAAGLPESLARRLERGE